jgi:hypothetical protein
MRTSKQHRVEIRREFNLWKRTAGFQSWFRGLNCNTSLKMAAFTVWFRFARAISSGVRLYCPDVFNGNLVYVPEEMGAQVDEDGEPVGKAA